MPSSIVPAVTLVPHPESRSTAVLSVGARVHGEPDGTLAIAYSIEGDPARLRVPPPQTPHIAHGLWLHTRCECFIALKGEAGYHEFNFSPSGEWAVYAFRKYREGEALADEALNPRIAVRNSGDKLELDASIALERLSSAHLRGKLALVLSAVIEDAEGMLSYWALKHPIGKPDFHHRDSFVLELG